MECGEIVTVFHRTPAKLLGKALEQAEPRRRRTSSLPPGAVVRCAFQITWHPEGAGREAGPVKVGRGPHAARRNIQYCAVSGGAEATAAPDPTAVGSTLKIDLPFILQRVLEEIPLNGIRNLRGRRSLRIRPV